MPRVERKVVTAGRTSSSREQASEQLRDLADLSINAKRCERIVLRVGQQRVSEREKRLEQSNRATTSANYGTNGGAAFSRPSTAPALNRPGPQRHGAGHQHGVQHGWPGL